MENIVKVGNIEKDGNIKGTEALHMASISFSNTPNTQKDSEIVELYWQRNESAISATEKKYSAYLTKIARNILGNTQDSEENVNDTYLRAWNSMPSHRPENLATYLGKIVRNLALNTIEKSSRQKRQGSQFAVSLSELEECVPDNRGGESLQQAVETKLLTDKINEWLGTCSSEMSSVFTCRHFYMDSVKAIAECYGMSESKVKSILHRARKGLKEFLEEEGFMI
jgi:RNA polymerase sigma-70 factor (ECF subfamily)